MKSRALYCLLPVVLLHLYILPLLRLIPAYPKELQPRCDYSDGQWVPSDTSCSLQYNGTSCNAIKDGHNCMANGRPDTRYLNWRWQPNQCNLPAFDPAAFLRLMRNHHISFIGDSLARNQGESLICLLSTASPPELVYRSGADDKFRRWTFAPYNTTISVFWSPFLVRSIEKSPTMGINRHTLFLDSPDEKWASNLDTMDTIVFTVGHWFFHSAIYKEGESTLGCHYCPEFNHTEISFLDVFGKVLGTTLGSILERSHGSFPLGKNVVLTTFSPAHFKGRWDEGGTCANTEPYKKGEKEVEFMDAEMRKIEMEEVTSAAAKARMLGSTGLRIQVLDVTKLALMRPDGHPGPYTHANPGPNVQNDCLHWCLPGPVDTWNEILFAMM